MTEGELVGQLCLRGGFWWLAARLLSRHHHGKADTGCPRENASDFCIGASRNFRRSLVDAKPVNFASGMPLLALEGIFPFTKPVAADCYDLSIAREHQWAGVCVWMGFHPATANFYSLRRVSGEAELHVFEVERHLHAPYNHVAVTQRQATAAGVRINTVH